MQSLPRSYEGWVWRRMIDRNGVPIIGRLQDAKKRGKWQRRHMRWDPVSECLTFHMKADIESPALWRIPMSQIDSVRLTVCTVVQQMCLEKIDQSESEHSDLGAQLKRFVIRTKYRKPKGEVFNIRCVNTRGTGSYEVWFASEVREETERWNEILSKIVNQRWFSTISTCLSPILDSPVRPRSFAAASLLGMKHVLKRNGTMPELRPPPKDPLPVPPTDNSRGESMVSLASEASSRKSSDDESPSRKKQKRSHVVTELPLKNGDDFPRVNAARGLKIKTRPAVTSDVFKPVKEEILSPPRTMIVKVSTLRTKSVQTFVDSNGPFHSLPLSKKPKATKPKVQEIFANSPEPNVSDRRAVTLTKEQNIDIQKELEVLNGLAKRLEEVTKDIEAPVATELSRNNSTSSKRSFHSSINEIDNIQKHANLFMRFLRLEQQLEFCEEVWNGLMKTPTIVVTLDQALKTTRELIVDLNDVQRESKAYIRAKATEEQTSDMSVSARRRLFMGMARVAKQDVSTSTKRLDQLRMYVRDHPELASQTADGVLSTLHSLREALEETRSVCRLFYLVDQTKMAYFPIV